MRMAALEESYHLPLRATEGLVRSLLPLMDWALPVPDSSTLSRRRRGLAVALPRRAKKESLHRVVDATGVKVYDQGEWKLRQHRYSKRRTWRNLHVGVEEATLEIVAAVVTTNSHADGEVLEDLLDQVQEPLEQVSGDGAYPVRNCYQAIEAHQARAVIPPRKGARIWQHGKSKAPPPSP